MTDRERLIELLRKDNCCTDVECKNCLCNRQNRHCYPKETADYLLANGVIVPPCKVGDIVYQIDNGLIYKIKVGRVIYDSDNIDFNKRSIWKTVFLTKEEAEKALEAKHDGVY